MHSASFEKCRELSDEWILCFKHRASKVVVLQKAFLKKGCHTNERQSVSAAVKTRNVFIFWCQQLVYFVSSNDRGFKAVYS